MHPLKRLAGYARSWRRDTWLAGLYSVLNKLFDVLPEILIGVAVDVVVQQRDSFLARAGIEDPVQQLLFLAFLTVLVWAFESLTEYLATVKWRNLAQNLQHELRMEAYEHLQRMQPGMLERQRSGRLMAVLNEDVHQIERFLNTGANDLIQVAISTVLIGFVFFFLTPTLGVLAILPIPLILIGAFWFLRRLAPRYAAAREAAADVSKRLSNNLLGMSTIQAYTAEDFEARHVREASDEYRLRNEEAIRVAAAITPVIRMAILAGFVATLLYGGLLTLRGELGVGSYSALVYLTQRLLWPLTRLAEMTDLYQRAMTSVERVTALLHLPRVSDNGRHALPEPLQGDIRFENIHFAYEEGRPILDDVSLVLPAERTVGLVGATGSGKSTLLKLLLRFEDLTEGRILLDGVDIRDVPRAELRRRIGFVAQDPFLTDGTLAENISYGDPSPDPSRIEAAARTAEIHAFIATLPDDYESQVGERGLLLSGGQRQRIALARAFYKKPPILILDEATSAVDNDTEAAIQRSLRQAAKGRTVLIVAHRLSTVRHASIIYVMDDGRIAESGSHDQLLEQNGLYAGLWRLQTGEISEG